MALFLGFRTTQSIWLAADSLLGTPTRKQPPAADPPRHAAVTEARSSLLDAHIIGPDDELHLIVGDQSSVRFLKGVRCHRWAAPERQSFRSLTNSLCLSTPEATWRQMAISLDLVDLTRLGYDLCGSFVPTSETWQRREPLTTPLKLSHFLQRTDQGKGSAVARKALGCLAGNSASPRETALALFLCLPRSVGGYGLPTPSMNVAIPLPHKGRHLAHNQYFVADLIWPEYKVCVEYDSDAFHGSEQRAVADSTKRNALLALGYHVVTLTNQQIKDARRLDEAAAAIAILLGRRLRIRSSTWMQKRYVLRKRLLFPAAQ